MTSPHHAARWSGRGKRSVQVDEPQVTPETTPETPVVETPPTPDPAPEPTPEPTPPTSPGDPPVEVQPELTAAPLATDAARAYAEQSGVDLAAVTGTGAEGRITKEDVVAYVLAAPGE